MWWRALLAAVAVSCTLTRILAQAPQRLDHIKDLLCVLVLNDVQKEDLNVSTLQKLQRHNVNINDLNNDELRNVCQTFESNKNNRLNTTKESVNAAIRLQNQTQNRDDGFNDKEDKNEDKPQKLFLIEPMKSDNVISHKDYNGDAQKTNCNEMMKYSHGQTSLNMMNFWKNCITVNKPINNYELPFNRQSFLNNTKASAFKNDKNNWQSFSFNNKFTKPNNFTQKYSYIPSANKNKKNMDNMLEHQSFNSPNLSKGQANSKVPEELLQQKPYPAFSNYNSERYDLSQNLRQAGIKHRFKMRGDTYHDTNEPNIDSFRRERVNVEGTTAIPYIPNHNYLDRDNELKTDPFRKKSVKVNELAKFNYNAPRPDNGLLLQGYKPRNDLFRKEPINQETSKFIPNAPISEVNRLHRYNEPNKHKLQNDLRIADELHQNIPYSNNMNLPYRENIPNTYLRGREPKISDDHLLYESKLNKHSLGKITVRSDESPRSMSYISNSPFVRRKNEATQSKSIRIDNTPKFIYDTPESDHFYRQNPLNEDLFSVDIAKKNNLPNLNRNMFSDKLFYANKDPNEDKAERLSVKVNESPKLILNIPVLDDNLYYSENERKKDLFRRGSAKVEDTNKSIPNVPAIPDEQLDYNENTSNKNKYQNEVGIGDDSSKVISKITNENTLSNRNIPNEGLRTSETVKEEPPIVIPDNPNFVYNTPDRDSYRGNEPSNDSPGTESIEFDETTKTIPNISKDTFIDINKRNKNLREHKSLRNIESTKNIPSDVITNIAESVKAILLRDLKKELTTLSTRDSTVTSTTSSTTITVPSTEQTTKLPTTTDVQVQDAVLNKFMKLFEQMTILKIKPFNVNSDNVRPNNQNTSETNFETTTTESVDIVSGNIAVNTKNKNKIKKRIEYNFEPQLHKSRANEESKKKKGKNVTKVQEKDKSKPVTIQTNSMEIRPLGVYVDKLLDPINQNIVLTTVRSGIIEQSEVKITNTQIDIKKNLLKPKVSKYYTYDDSKPVSNTNQNLRISESSKYNNYRDIEMDKYADYNERGAPRFYERLENINSNLYASEPKITLDRAECCNRKYISQLMHECCNEKVVSRHQVSLANLKGRQYDDAHFNSLMKSQQKVNSMLEKILAARNKFRSVENI